MDPMIKLAPQLVAVARDVPIPRTRITGESCESLSYYKQRFGDLTFKTKEFALLPGNISQTSRIGGHEDNHTKENQS